MLEGMRRASQRPLGRIIMGLVMGFISLSFAIWGVGNIFVGYGSNNVAEVGGTEISADQVRQLYQAQLKSMQRQARRSITNEQARQMGLDQQVVGKLIADAALDGKARSFGLAMSDATLARKILADTTFAGPTGKFDTNRFNEILSDNGFTEQTFAREQRKQYLRQDFADAFTGGMIAPVAALEAIHKFRNETRSIEYVELPDSAAGAIAAPDDQTLQTFFDARKQQFSAPEFRSLATLSVTPTALIDAAAVSDADAQTLYDRVKGQRFGAAAKRELEQVVFADEASARRASEKIKAGQSLSDAAKEANLQIVQLGELAKSDIVDPALAEAAFALEDGGVSGPLKTPFGYALVHVVKATPESVKPFADVAADLKTEIANERARKAAADIHDKIEDERTSGKALDEAAAAAGRTVMKITAVDQNGRDPAGAEVSGLPERDALLRAAFASDVGVDNETLTTRDGGYVWYEVLNVERAHERSLAEVRDKVAAAWRDDEAARLLGAKAAELVKKIEAGASVEDIGKEMNLPVKNVSDVKRVGATSVPQALVIRVFNLKVGQAGSAAATAGGRIVFKILDSATPEADLDSDVMKTVKTQLQQAYSEDLLSEYLAKLQLDGKVSINQAALRAATGGADSGGQ